MRVFFLLLMLVVLGMLRPQDLARAQEFSTPLAGSATPSPTLPPQVEAPALNLSYPAAGETLRGQVPISGLATLPGLTGWELAFSYEQDPTETWFVLLRGEQPTSGEFFRWDTQTLADGDYRLRLRVFLPDGVQEVQARGLKVRNYTFDTPTPLPSATLTRTPARTLPPRPPSQTPLPSLTAFPSPRPAPPNPASLSTSLVWFSFARGAALTLILFAVFALLLRLRR